MHNTVRCLHLYNFFSLTLWHTHTHTSYNLHRLPEFYSSVLQIPQWFGHSKCFLCARSGIFVVSLYTPLAHGMGQSSRHVTFLNRGEMCPAPKSSMTPAAGSRVNLNHFLTALLNEVSVPYKHLYTSE